MKVFYRKRKPKIIQYRSYKNLDNQVFQRELNSELLKIDLKMLNYQNLLKSFCQYLTSMLQKKRKFIRANNSNFVTENLRKAIIKRSKLRNKYLRERTNETKNLSIGNNLGDNITNPNITDPVFCAIQKYEKHPSILKIKEMMGTNNISFSFKFIDRKKIFNELQKLKSKKSLSGERYTG